MTIVEKLNLTIHMLDKASGLEKRLRNAGPREAELLREWLELIYSNVEKLNDTASYPIQAQS
jgi:hypothetical protein